MWLYRIKVLFGAGLIVLVSSCTSQYYNVEYVAVEVQEDSVIVSKPSIPFVDGWPTYDFELPKGDFIGQFGSLDSVATYTDQCGFEAYSLSRTSQGLTVQFNYEELKQKPECLDNHPALILRFQDQIRNIKGDLSSLEMHDSFRQVLIWPTTFLIEKNYSKYPQLQISVDSTSILNYKKRSRWNYKGFIIDPLPGFGPIWVNGGMENSISGRTFINMGLAFVLNHMRFGVRLASLENSIKDDATSYSEYDWAKSTTLELGVGREIWDTQFHTITPMVYGGLRRFSISQEIDELDDVELKRRFAYALGLTLDIKVQQFFRSKIKRAENQGVFIGLKIDSGVYPSLSEPTLGGNSSFYYCTAGLTLHFGGPVNPFKIVPLEK